MNEKGNAGGGDRAIKKADVRELLKRDEETITLLNELYPRGHKALDTPERRAAWRYGYENPTVKTGVFSHPDTAKERFHGIRLLHPQQLTENDSYYVCLGKVMRK